MNQHFVGQPAASIPRCCPRQNSLVNPSLCELCALCGEFFHIDAPRWLKMLRKHGFLTEVASA